MQARARRSGRIARMAGGSLWRSVRAPSGGKRGCAGLERLWTRSFVLLSLGSLFLFTAFYMLLPTMPLFIKELGGLDVHVGLAAGAFTIAAVIVRPFAGG